MDLRPECPISESRHACVYRLHGRCCHSLWWDRGEKCPLAYLPESVIETVHERDLPSHSSSGRQAAGEIGRASNRET